MSVELVEGERITLTSETVARMTEDERATWRAIIGDALFEQIANAPAPATNGVYTVGEVGSADRPWTLERKEQGE